MPPSGSAIYRYKDEKGQVQISSVPLPGRTPFEVTPIGPPPGTSAGTPSPPAVAVRPGSTESGTSGPSFKVSSDVQKARDNDVRRILQEELADQQDLLAKAASPDDRRRHEANIRELNKELARVKR